MAFFYVLKNKYPTMKTKTHAVVLLICLAGCDKQDDNRTASNCLDGTIRIFDQQATCTDPDVKEYLFQNKTVYVFNPGNCGADMHAEVIDINCKTLGYLGGITGNTKINREEFDHAVFVRTVWHR